MNEFDKELNKELNKKEDTKIQKVKKWWGKNRYKVLRVVLFPLWIACILKEKYDEYCYNREQFSIEKCEKFFDKYLAKICEYDKESQTFWIDVCDYDVFYWNSFVKSRRDKIFAKKNGREMKLYLIEEYEVEGYKKIVEKQEYMEQWIGFEKIEKIQKKGLTNNPFYAIMQM